MSRTQFFAGKDIRTTVRHCEAQFGTCLTFVQPSVAASPKQSPCSELAVKRVCQQYENLFSVSIVKGDCFVASSLQSSVNDNFFWVLFNNASRNDEWKRNVTFVSSQTQYFVADSCNYSEEPNYV
jgi:hypothetical protein